MSAKVWTKDYEDCYSSKRPAVKGTSLDSPLRFYETAAGGFSQSNHDHQPFLQTLEAERDWWLSGRPTIYLPTDIKNDLIDTRCTFEWDLIKFPWPSVVIIAPNESPFIIKQEQVWSLLVWRQDSDCGKFTNMGIRPTGTFGAGGTPGHCSILSSCGHRTVEQALSEFSITGLIEAWRVALGCVLFASGADRVLEPRLNSMQKKEYDEARAQANKDSLEKAAFQKAGRKKWVFKPRWIDLPRRRALRDSLHETGRHLKYRHQRDGHYHVVRFGPSRQYHYVKWFRPLWVRPDLPPPPEKHRKRYRGKRV